MKLHELYQAIDDVMYGDPAQHGPYQPLAWPSDYEVEFLVPSGGDWSGMQADVTTVTVDHQNRKVVLS